MNLTFVGSSLFFFLVGFFFLLFLGQKLKRIHTSIIGTGSIFCSFVLCLFLFSSFLAGGNNLADKNFEYYFYPWLEIRWVAGIGKFSFGFSFFCDGVDYYRSGVFNPFVFCWLYERREIFVDWFIKIMLFEFLYLF